MAFGRADRVDPKFAPMGTLAVAQNLRLRKDGRLASRNGYQPLDMTDAILNDMVAYDLFEFSDGRLCALGASNGEGHPVDIYEYRGIPAGTPWRPTDESGSYRPTLTPFTNPRAVAGAPQPAGGMRAVDCAAGGGYVCVVYQTQDGGVSGLAHIQIVRESDDQVIFARDGAQQGWSKIRVTWAGDRFFFLAFDGANGDLELGSFVPGTSLVIATLATVESSALNSMTIEIEPVSNPTNSAVIVIYGDGDDTTADVVVKRYNSSGTQQGSTLTISGLDEPRSLAIEADEADNTLNVVITQYDVVATDTTLRTYNFSNTLLDGPTALTTGERAQICRLPARGSWPESVAVASCTGLSATDDITVEWVTVDTHAISATRVIGNAINSTAMVSAATDGQPTGVVIGGFVGGDFDVNETNALFYISSSMVHMATRDLLNSARNAEDFYAPLGLALDTSTGRLAWCSVYFSGTGKEIENYTIVTLDLNSPKRRQVCSAGGITYLTGGPIQLYDGRSVTEAAFNEAPTIKSITAASSGSLANSATYQYVMVWEYTLPDGTFYESRPSAPFEFETGATEDEAVVTVHGPHSARVALGDATYGAEVTGVLYRTVWEPVSGSSFSEFKETQRFTCPSTMADYGDDIVVNDGRSDTSLASRATLYTQGGPIEHDAPEMGSYISASSARVSVAGLARSSEFQESKEQELDEAINFSVLSSYFTRSPGPLNGILSLDGIRLLFTRSDLFTVTGDGPDNFGGGALPQPVELPSPGGLRDWRSLLKGPDGVWYQLDDTKLYRSPRGSGAPEWRGVDVQDTLADFPVITGAARCRADDALAFACQDAEAGTDGRILVRSLRTEVWSVDTPPLESGAGIEALSSFGDRLAYISGGVVYQLHATSFADDSSTVITTLWKTHPLYPFEIGGNGLCHDLQMTGEFRGAGDLALRVSYDDGISFTTYDTFTLSGLTVGATVKRRWSLQQSDVQSVVAELTFTPSTPSEGLIINQLTLLVDPSNGLEDLNPEDMA